MAGTVTIKILGDASQFKRTIGGVDSQVGKLEGTGKKIGGAFKAMAGGIAIASAGTAFKGALDAASESLKVAAQTNAVVKSTGGAAGVTVEHVDKLAHSLQNLSGVQDESIQTGQNMLLTFTNVKNGVGKGADIFDQASRAMLDMSIATGSDARTAALQLGKALNDPVKGVTALRRVGVQFTKEQQNQIKTLAESGDLMGAQKMILAELNKEFGGSAKAAGAAQTPMERLSLVFGDLQETIGKKLLPIIEKLAKWLQKHQAIIVPLAVLIGGVLTAATVAWGVSLFTAGGALAFLISPVTLVVAAVAALAAGVVYAYTHFETFRNIVDGAWQVLQDVWDAITKVAVAIYHFGQMAVDFALKWTPVGQFLQHLPEILGFVRDAFGWVIDKIKTLINWLKKIPEAADKALGPLDEIVGKAGGVIGGAAGKVGGLVGKIPGFALGGVVPGPIGRPMLAVVHGGETVTPPNESKGGVNIYGGLHFVTPRPEDAGRMLLWELGRIA